MKKLLIFIAILSQTVMASDLEIGKEKFNSNCAACHGANGERKALGISQVIAEIGDKKTIEGLLKSIKENGAKSGINMAMVNAVSHLSDEDIVNLSAYISTLSTNKQ